MEPNILKADRRQPRSREEIRQLLQEFDSAGINVKTFCARHGINPATYYNWRKKLREDKSGSIRQAGFIELLPASIPGSLFAEVNGIRLYQAVSADYLKALAL